jgi:hypothetical protein
MVLFVAVSVQGRGMIEICRKKSRGEKRAKRFYQIVYG